MRRTAFHTVWKSSGPPVASRIPHRLNMHRLAPLVALACALNAPILAQPAAPDLLDLVIRTPAVDAARKRVDAARARANSAGRLADPEIEAMGSRVNADAMGQNRDMWELNLRQPLPKRGERAADRERASAAISMAEAELALSIGELAADVAMALAEAEGAESRARLLEAQLNRMGAVLRTMETRLAAGASVRLADRLTVQSRIASLQLALERARRIAEDSRTLARGRLALPPDAALPPFSAPENSDINPADSVVSALALARSAEANAMTRMARASANPSTAVGVRFERERSSMGNQDIVGLAFSSEIPFRNQGYARADVRAAEAERAAAQSDAASARYRVSTILARLERAERFTTMARRLGDETEKRLAAEHDVLSRAVSVGAASGTMAGESAVLHAVEILEKSTDTHLEIIEAETAARTTRAELWRYLPASKLLRTLNSQPSTLN